MLFDKILVPVDLSDVSEEQIKAVAQLEMFGMKEVIILFVSPLGEASAEEREFMLRLVNLLDSERVRVRPLISKGKPAQIILKVAKKEQVTLIAMASSGKTKAKELVVGSVSLAVVRSSKVPVLVGKYGIQEDSSRRDLLYSVLVSLDLGKCTQSIMAVFKEIDLAGCRKAVLFHVVPSNKYSPEDDGRFQEVKRDLTEWREAHKGTCEVDTHLHYGTPAYNIMEASREFEATLIIMGNVGKGLLHSMTLGSVSDEVLRKATNHVLIVPC